MNEERIETIKIALEKRILNEFSAKILNEERIDQIHTSRKKGPLSSHSEVTFNCECDDKSCKEKILMSTQEYTHVHRKTKNFIVVPSHVRLDIEEIVSEFSTYAVVAKYFPHKAAASD
jgi:hypothetical protein